MRFPSECCRIHQTLRQTMPHLSEAQSKGLALWVFGTKPPKADARVPSSPRSHSREGAQPSGRDSESGSTTGRTDPRPRRTR